MIDKLDPGRENRTFKTRLQFINGVFANPHMKDEILASSIQFKLRKTYESYLSELDACLNKIAEKESIKTLKNL